MSLIKLIDLPSFGDERGGLIAIESDQSIPFQIKRLYYIVGNRSGGWGGVRAHHNVREIAVCVKGSCRMILDDGQHRDEVWLDIPNKGLLIGDLVWREMHDFSDDCVLLVLASEHYDEADYIRDYKEFLRCL